MSTDTDAHRTFQTDGIILMSNTLSFYLDVSFKELPWKWFEFHANRTEHCIERILCDGAHVRSLNHTWTMFTEHCVRFVNYWSKQFNGFWAIRWLIELGKKKWNAKTVGITQTLFLELDYNFNLKRSKYALWILLLVNRAWCMKNGMLVTDRCKWHKHCTDSSNRCVFIHMTTIKQRDMVTYQRMSRAFQRASLICDHSEGLLMLKLFCASHTSHHF